MGIWKDMWHTEAESWTFGHIGPVTEVVAHRKYLSIMLRQLRIVDARVGFSRFYGAVEFYGCLPGLSGTLSEFASVTSPSKLRDISKKDLGNFVFNNQRLLGPVPYVGGDLELEVGLFAIKSQDLLMPYLELLSELSDITSLAFPVATPYIPVIKKGASALMRPEGSSSLEIGASVTFNPVQVGTYFAVRIDSRSCGPSKFGIDSSFYLLDDQGKRINDAPYLIFSVDELPVRDDWHQIPAISASYNQLMDVVRKQKTLRKLIPTLNISGARYLSIRIF